MFRTLSPLLDRLGKWGLGGVYKMGFWGLGGKRGRGGVKGGVSRCIMGEAGRRSSFQREKCYQKLESISPSIFVERN